MIHVTVTEGHDIPEARFDVLYIETGDAVMVRHAQMIAVNRADAIKQARNELGIHAYFISVEEHKGDMNEFDEVNSVN